MDYLEYPLEYPKFNRFINQIMATLSLTLFKAKALKDGTHKIRIAIRHNHQTSYIVTRFIVTENQFRNGQVIKRADAAIMNKKLRKMLDDYQDKVDNIRNIEAYTCVQVKQMITSVPQDQITVISATKSFVDELVKEGRIPYSVSIERCGRYFTDYIKGDIPLEGITPNMVKLFREFIKRKGVTEATVNTIMAQFKATINRAIRMQLVSYEVHPFVSTKISASPVRKLDIGIESLNRIRKSEPKVRRLRIAKDLFMLSFYLGGMNLIDIMDVDFRSDKIVYSRTKTKERSDMEITLGVPAEARAIVERWMDRRTGKLKFGYKFTYHNFSQYVSYSITKLAHELGIKDRVTFYSARKTFAQFAADIGIPDGVIDYCLGHSDKKRGIIRYYTKIRGKQADAAIARVIDYIDNPDKYKDYLELRNNFMMF